MPKKKSKAPKTPKVTDHGEGPHVCQGCANWNRHGKACWIFWDEKKICSQYADETGDWRPGFRLIKELDEFMR